MKNHKKIAIIIVILSLVLLLSAFFFIKLFYNKSTNYTSNDKDLKTEENVLSILVPSYTFQGTNEKIFEDAANEILSSKGMDFVVDYITVGKATDYCKALTDYIKRGKNVDLFYSGNTTDRGYPDGITNSHMQAYQNGFILPFEDYIDTEEGKIIFNLFSDTYWNSLRINGKINGILAIGNGISTTGGIFVKHGLMNDKIAKTDTEYNMEQFIDLLSDLKGIGNKYPLSLSDDLASRIEFLGYTFLDAAIAVDEERGAFNVFEDPVFLDSIHQAAQLVKEGYINPDITAPYEEKPVQVLGSIFDGITTISGYDLYRTTSPIVPSMSTALCISSTSKYPDKAVELIALALKDLKLADALVYGKEGVDFERTEDGRVVETATHSFNFLLPWYTGLYYFCSPAFDDPSDKKQIYMDYISKAVTSSLTGFTFDTRGWEDKIYNINTIIKNALVSHIITKDSEYDQSTGLLIGLDSNWESTINRIVMELKNKGIDDLVQEVNRQLAEWKSKYQRN